jgi:hypothetical protein
MVVDLSLVLAFFPLVSFFFLTGLGIYVLRAGTSRPENLVFGVFSLMLAIQSLAESVVFLISASDVATRDLLQRIQVWTTLPLPFIFLYFAMIFPRKTRFLGGAGGALLTGAISGLTIGLYEVLTVATKGDINCLAYSVVNGRSACAATPLGVWGLGYTIGLALVALWVLWGKFKTSRTHIEHERGRLLLTAFAFLVAGTLPSPLLLFTGILFALTIKVFLSLMTVLFAIASAYAILKYQVFKAETALRKGVSYTFTIVLITLTWIIAGELLEGVVGDQIGAFLRIEISDTMASVISAVMVAPFIAPVEKGTSRLLLKLFPKLQEAQAEGQISKRARDIYQAALEEAWHDGALKGREREVLMRLREALGIPMDTHETMEASVRQRLAPKAPVARARAARP